MAANITNHPNLSKKAFRILIFGVFSQFCFIFGMVILPLNSKSMLDVVRNPLFASKLATTTVLVLHTIFQMYLWTKGSGVSAWKQNTKMLQDFGRCVLMFCMSVVLFYCLAVLFGAAFSEKTGETFHFALLLSASTCAPTLIHLGLNADAWLRVFIHGSPEIGIETSVFYTSICSIVGAWLGAFPLPLDWDRPWQVWPISCVIGILIGHGCGLLLTAVQLCRQYYRTHKSKVN